MNSQVIRDHSRKIIILALFATFLASVLGIPHAEADIQILSGTGFDGFNSTTATPITSKAKINPTSNNFELKEVTFPVFSIILVLDSGFFWYCLKFCLELGL